MRFVRAHAIHTNADSFSDGDGDLVEIDCDDTFSDAVSEAGTSSLKVTVTESADRADPLGLLPVKATAPKSMIQQKAPKQHEKKRGAGNSVRKRARVIALYVQETRPKEATRERVCRRFA